MVPSCEAALPSCSCISLDPTSVDVVKPLRPTVGFGVGEGLSPSSSSSLSSVSGCAPRPGVASIGSVSGSESAQALSTVAPCKESRVAASDLLPGCSAIRPHTPRPMYRDAQQRYARLDRVAAIGWPEAQRQRLAQQQYDGVESSLVVILDV